MKLVVTATWVALVVLCLVGTAPWVAAVPPTWSWDTLQTFVHCSNKSGPLNPQITELMSNSSFTVLEKYQCLDCAPERTGGEDKVLAAAAAIRALNPTAPVFFYFAIDYARTWYTLGGAFDEQPNLEVHNADGTLANVTNDDNGHNVWRVFDFAVPAALSKWADGVAAVVHEGGLDGVFIDGYRDPPAWTTGLIPRASAAEQAAWLDAAWNKTGVALAAALPPAALLLPNGNPLTAAPPPGYNAVSIEFFEPSVASIALLQTLAENRSFVEVHAYIGDNRALFEATLAAYLVGFGEGAYWGAGNTWDTCESWLVDWQLAQYWKPLGQPHGVAKAASRGGGTQYTRSFATGTRVDLWVPGQGGNRLSCIRWADGSELGNAC